MGHFRAVLLLTFLSIPAWGADLPQGALPRMDGRVGTDEWRGSYTMPVPHGTARLRVAGRVLCVAIEIQRPYSGERIDLRTSDPAGDRFTLIQLHPACYLPRPPFSALPPVMMKRTTWKDRAKAKYAVPYSVRFRAAVLQKDAKSWSAEFCVALESLDLPIADPAVFNLTTSHPFSAANRPLTTPPAQWEPLKANWDPKADLFVTAKEDEVHAWALQLFREGLDRARDMEPATPILGAAFDSQMSERKIAEQLALADLEVKIAPNRYHGLWYRLHLLRRANRLEQADAAYRMLVERLPRAERLHPVVQERNAALLTECRFDEFERENRGIGTKTMDWVQEIRTAWEFEAVRRKRAATQTGDRLLLKTSRGDIEIALYEFDEDGYDAKLAKWLADARFADTAPKWATGALGIAWTGLPSGARAPKVDHPPLAWRGTVTLLGDRSLVLATGPVHITRRGCAIGLIVKGMEHVDAMTASDRIVSATVVPAPVRDGGD